MTFKEQLLENINLISLLSKDNKFEEKLEFAIEKIVSSVSAELPLLVCGNGGSAADSEHIVGELVGRFLKERKAINAISLSSNSASLTAWSNDYDYSTIFERQVEAYGKKGGVLLGISTSGNSKNVILAAKKAKELNLFVIGLTGEGGGLLARDCDILLDVPSNKTPRIQELHILTYHYLCERVELLYKG
ncbi:MAG: SIS domain-containing protein [Spirochaetia bacterium]|nr:SIS domain-containing protein [Spirochaetia bacterium]